MFEKNNGVGEENILQNQFTAYLQTAIRNTKVQYLRQKSRTTQHEVSYENLINKQEPGIELDLLANLPFIEQLGDQSISSYLTSLTDKDLKLLLMKAIVGMDYISIAVELNISAVNARVRYHRIIKKLREIGR